MITAFLSTLLLALVFGALGHKSSIKEGVTRPGPAAHYVIRTSSLKETLIFTSKVLGLSVLRHEENPQACAITCNGDYDVPWSKTMVGTKPENEAYALEITYSYGVEKYSMGTGLASIEVWSLSQSCTLSSMLTLAIYCPYPARITPTGVCR